MATAEEARDAEVAARVLLNKLLRGEFMEKPIQGPKLDLRVLEPGRAIDADRGKAVYFLSDKFGYSRALHGADIVKARELMRQLKAIAEFNSVVA